jgi:hypothetical protein
MQPTLTTKAAIMPCRSDIQNYKLWCDKSFIDIKVGEIGKAKDLPTPIRMGGEMEPKVGLDRVEKRE